jgi:predicted DNA-binding transcriptional regulator YafY
MPRLGAHHRRIWDEKELARIVAARRGGLTTAEIAERFGCTSTTIERRLAELRARGVPLA